MKYIILLSAILAQAVFAAEYTIEFKPDTPYSKFDKQAIKEELLKLCPGAEKNKVLFQEEQTFVYSEHLDPYYFEISYKSVFRYATQEGNGIYGFMSLESKRSSTQELFDIRPTMFTEPVCD
jgi:hypothetical protein